MPLIAHQIADQLQLDPAQQKKVDQIARKYSRRAMPAAEYQEKLVQVHKAEQAGQAEVVERLRRELVERPTLASQFDPMLDEMEGILNEQQKPKFSEIRRQLAALGGQTGAGVLRQLGGLPASLKLNGPQRERFDDARS
jgi:uncharacterized membrane-anchored protein YjiN (DUF445 family)